MSLVRDIVSDIVADPVADPTGATFSPLDISSLLHWYDFSDADTITESGGAITAMTAKGTSNSLTADGTGPSWTSGNNYATASGAGYLQLASALTAYPMVVVFSIKTPSTGQAGTVFSSANSSTANNARSARALSATGVDALDRAGGVIESAVDGQGALAVSTNVVGVSALVSSASRKARRDDNAFGSTNSNSVTSTVDISTLLGINNGGSKSYTPSGTLIYDCLIFSSEPSADEYADLLTYLQSKHV